MALWNFGNLAQKRVWESLIKLGGGINLFFETIVILRS